MYKYTLTDLFDIYEYGDDLFSEDSITKSYNEFSIKDYMELFYRNGNEQIASYSDDYLNTLFRDYIIPATSNSGIYETCTSLIEKRKLIGKTDFATYLKESKEIQEVMDKIIFFIKVTYQRYTKLLSLYESKQNELLEGLSSKVERYDSDTPQSDTNGNIKPTWVSYYNKIESKNDDMSIANKLNSLFTIIRQYYNDWSYDYFKIVMGGIK